MEGTIGYDMWHNVQVQRSHDTLGFSEVTLRKIWWVNSVQCSSLVYHVIMFRYSGPLASIWPLEPEMNVTNHKLKGGEFEHHTHLIANYSVRHRCPPRKSGLPVVQTICHNPSTSEMHPRCHIKVRRDSDAQHLPTYVATSDGSLLCVSDGWYYSQQ